MIREARLMKATFDDPESSEEERAAAAKGLMWVAEAAFPGPLTLRDKDGNVVYQDDGL